MTAREWPCRTTLSHTVNQGEPCREQLVMHEKHPPSSEAPQNSLSHPPFSSALFSGSGAAFRSADMQYSL